MKRPRWVDRELRIHRLNVLLAVKSEASSMWFRHYRRSLVERHRMAVENAELRAELAKYEGNPS